MSNSVFNLSNGAACEPGKLIVQVVGKDHPTTQKLAIYDKAVEARLEEITQKDKPETQISDTFASVLHVWDWECQSKNSLCLEIATNEGAPICLPLLEALGTTPRQPEHSDQWNQIVPVVPMTALSGSKSTYDLGTPVALRRGYVYVFRRGKLWRELEVRDGESGLSYHDVRVDSYRQSNGFNEDLREAVGVGLEEIWLPAKWNDHKEVGIELCFSEIQLNAARLNYLESDTAARSARTSKPQLDVSKARLDELFKGKPDGLEIIEAYKEDGFAGSRHNHARVVRRNLDLWAFPLSVVAPQRSRQPGFEWLLDHPGSYICDLTGQFSVEQLNAAKAFLTACAAGETAAAPPDMEMAAMKHAMKEKLASQTPEDSSLMCEAPVWEAQASESDILAPLRERQLCAVLLDDHHFRMRHLWSRITDSQELLQTCAAYARLNEHFSSALLIKETVVPRSVGGGENKLHSCISRVTPAGLQDLNRCTATIERMEAWWTMQASQQCLIDLFEHAGCQQTLADHLSLDGFCYTSALKFAAQAIQALAETPADHDPLAVESRRLIDAVAGRAHTSEKYSKGREFVLQIAEQDQHPLHAMFWPECNIAELEEDYVPPETPAQNIGNGAFRAAELAAQESRAADSAGQNTFDAARLQGALENGMLASTAITDSKSVSNALITIYEHLDGALRTAISAKEQAELDRDASRQGTSQAQNQQGTAHREKNAATQDRQQTEQEHQDAANKQKATQAELDQRAQARASTQAREKAAQRRIAASLRPMKVRMHGMGIEQLRSMMPQEFGALRLMRRSAALAGDHYILGVSDAPLDIQRSIRVYGEIQDGAGNIISSTNQRIASRHGVTAVTEDYMVAAMPKNHLTTRLVSALQRHTNARMMLEQAESLAQEANAAAAASAAIAGRSAAAARASENTAAARLQQAEQLARTARTELQQAQQTLDDLTQTVEAGQRNAFFKVLNSGAFSAAVTFLELWNLSVELESSGSTFQEKGLSRVIFGTGAAVLDAFIAVEMLAFKMKEANRFSTLLRATRWTLDPRRFVGFLGPALGDALVTQISIRLLVSAAASLVTMVVCILEAVHAWRKGDEAVWGYGVMAAGALMGAIAPFFSGSAALGGMNPFGLAALVLVLVGAGLVFWLSSTELEDWLENGPFGEKQTPYLVKDGQEALYRLASIFAGIRIAIENNPLYEPDAKIDINQDACLAKLVTANTRISISSNLPGLLGHLGNTAIEPHCRLRVSEVRYRGNGAPYPPTHSYKTSALVAKRSLAESCELYVNTPAAEPGSPSTSFWSYGKIDVSRYYDWQVRAQFKLLLDNGGQQGQLNTTTLLFPAPPINMGKANAVGEYPLDFSETDSPFWADEKTHAAT
ncbi:hypothetical protein [Halopseudomonas sp.]|uniref:hypothetical protein n=1 Tax=Halopseudomonas sp. TaxID=2901191 RepID=UPI003002956B